VKFCRASAKTICQAKARQKKPQVLLLVAGWLVLTLYFLDFSPVGIYAAALAGSFDSTHEARVESAEHGLHLVLHHTHGCIGHHHGIVARTLTLFAQPATAGSPDHVIQFGSADNFSSPTQMLPSLLALAGLPLPALDEISVVVPNSALAVAEAPRPPPCECGLLTCLRSTVFLI
jgi:hypothetical protein